MKNNIITIRELAEMLKLTEKTIYRLASEAEIPGFKVGGSWRFRRDEIDAWTRSQSNIKKDMKTRRRSQKSRPTQRAIYGRG